MDDLVLLKKDGPIAEVIFNRPEVHNAYNMNSVRRLEEIYKELKHDLSIRAVILYGAGETAFSSGGDINKEFMSYSAIEASREVKYIQDVFSMIEQLPSPVIAAVNGYCFGGGFEMALAADIRLASYTAVFGLPEVTIGILPGAGGTQRLIRYIGGRSLANEILMAGKRINAEEAYRVGLVSELYENNSELLAGARKKAVTIATNCSPRAAENIKKCVINGQSMNLDGGLRFEGELWGLLYSTDDQKEGMLAFKEKRKPIYKGK
jgi:enoyl-CoA hydratase